MVYKIRSAIEWACYVTAVNDERLAELAQFLRTMRERLRPADAGIAVGPRRRTPGLRREEVAQLAGVSVAWYTFLEQGRPVRASEAVLDWLAQVLRLNPAERLHLYLLARGHAPSDRPPVSATVSTTLQALINAVPYPAYAVSLDWTVVAWNEAARLVMADFERLSGPRAESQSGFSTDPSQKRLLVNWEDQAKSVLSLFRSTTAHNVGEEWHDKLVKDLAAQSPEFRVCGGATMCAHPTKVPRNLITLLSAECCLNRSPYGMRAILHYG